MALVNLGGTTLAVGGAPFQFNPFPYDETKSYLLALNMTLSVPSNIFSRLQLTTIVDVPGQPQFRVQPPLEINIVDGISSFYVDFSPLFRGSGSCIIEVERIPISFLATADTPLTVDLLYDDAFTIDSWRA